LGFKKFGDEGKVMALASYGNPATYSTKVKKILLQDLQSPSFKLNLRYFVHHNQRVSMTWATQTPVLGQMFSARLVDLLGRPREQKDPIHQNHKDIAASFQQKLEQCLFHIIRLFAKMYKIDTLCLAGGVGYNCCVNGKIPLNTPIKRLFIQPAAGDSGTAIGAAFFVYHHILNYPRDYTLSHVYLGPSYDNNQIKKALESEGLHFRFVENPESICAEALSKDKIVGWFQGRMEFGPRALGNRSILANPSNHKVKEILNARIKHREPFRPFAPSILEEYVNEYFKYGYKDPFMITVDWFYPDKAKLVPAVVHMDGTGRLQAVSKNTNETFWEVIENFRKITNIPMVLNTSFNENEPIVCSPEDAIKCFKTTRMDMLIMGNYVVERE
jgi:carbamoyltransferase